MSDNPDDYSLYHYGVKGMRWGKTTKKTGVERSADRKKIRSEFKSSFSAKTGKDKVAMGSQVAYSLMGGAGASQVVGYKIAKAAGYSKGKSLAIGVLGGAPGGLIASEIAVRRNEID